jgi:hypothetical protein
MSLKTTSSVNPIILKGSRINQTIGRMNIMARARGQQIASKIHQSTRAMNVFMVFFEDRAANAVPQDQWIGYE